MSTRSRPSSADSLPTTTSVPRRERWYNWLPTSKAQLASAEEAVLKPLERLCGDYTIQQVDIGNSERINTLSVGNGPPVVLVHGMAAGVGFWMKNIPAISKSYRVHAIDLLGFGRSSRTPYRGRDESEAETYFVDSIERWRKSMKLNEFALMGHSMGAYVAAAYALAHPERVNHLLMADPWGMPPFEAERLEHYPRKFKVLASIVTRYTPLAALRAIGPWGPGLLKSRRPDLAQKFTEELGSPDVLMDYLYHINAQCPTGESAFAAMSVKFGWAKNPMMSRLPTLHDTIPLTFIYGGSSWISRDSGDIVLEQMQGRSKKHVINNAGHHVYADRAEKFNEIVLQELNEWKHYKAEALARRDAAAFAS